MKTPKKQRIIYRQWPETQGSIDGEAIAIFPDEEWSDGCVASYMIVGQHGSCDRSVIGNTRLADMDDDQVKELQQNLVASGYNLDEYRIMKKWR